MSSYRGRHGPNFSQYLNDLNTLSPQDNPVVEDNDFSNDLAMYTNTDFTNLDMPSLGEDGTFNWDLSPENQDQDTLKYEDLLAGPDAATDFGNFGTIDAASAPLPQPFYTTYNTPIQPAPPSGFPQAEQTPQSALPRDNRRSRAGTVQSLDHVPTEEKSRVAAEEDKRRRNTAASARFRVKKKQREQALEKTLKEAQDKSSKLEARVSQLEVENQWLKNLITEKNGLSSKAEIAAAYEEHQRESEERDLKQQSSRTQGVGTS
ncbi:hypothetical protein PMZ80_003233 [Knufia obscura]|uniref:BZIP domain-containing protein n=2 Tax=Knufia TaxID=430999 RepID=A0AAN8EBS7_9EURO|nr:hypothetical protein PMZ80_003233 [Knufia obscura]KAK5950350.1 hypothetical protein OHC33_008569 [Knufia fluminis]